MKYKNITNTGSLFNGCESLSSLLDVSKYNINNVTNISL